MQTKVVHTRSLRKTAIDTRWPSMVSAISDMCHRSHAFIMGVCGIEYVRPRARHMLYSLALHLRCICVKKSTYPLSSTNRAIQVRSRLRNSLLPNSELGSTSWNPSEVSATLGSMQSALETLIGGSALCESSGINVL